MAEPTVARSLHVSHTGIVGGAERSLLTLLDGLGPQRVVGVACPKGELADAVRRRLGSLSTQAAYDNLRALTEAGLVRRIELAGGPARYEVRVGDNHHHVMCRRCGATADVDCIVGEAPCLEPVETHGFRVEEAQVTFLGLCPACQAGGATAGAGPAPQ